MAYAVGGGTHTLLIEFQPVELTLVHAAFARPAHIDGVGFGDDAGIGVKRVSDGEQQRVLRVGGGAGENGLRLGRGVGTGAHPFENLLEFHAPQPTPYRPQNRSRVKTTG